MNCYKLLMLGVFLIYPIKWSHSNDDHKSKLAISLKECRPFQWIDSSSNDDNSTKMERKVIGPKGKLCKYVEKDESGVMVCYYPQDSLNVVLPYIYNVLSGNINIDKINEIEMILAKECNFHSLTKRDVSEENIKNMENGLFTRDLSSEATAKEDNNFSEINSMFFTPEEMKEIKKQKMK